MIDALLPVLFAGAALGALTVIVRHLAALPAQARALTVALGGCAPTREVRYTIRTLDVVPEGGTVLRGSFSAERRRPAPPADLPAAA